MTSLGKYELHEQLGKGGFGTVYRATDNTLGREVALKILHPQLMVDEEFISRFKREARTLASLDNHHIVTIYEIGEEDGRIFIAMRYLPGGSLKQRIQVNGPIPFDQALSILQQVCNGLSEAHTKGMVHRDIKPENILFDGHGEAVVTDFGLVKAATTSGLSTTGVLMGTPAYIAPEIWSGKPATPATDVYPLACVLYEMLTGKVLHQGESTPEVMKKHFDPLVLPETWPTGVPAGINRVMESALAKDPQQRYQQAGEFPAALGRLEEQIVEPTPAVPLRPAVSRQVQPVTVNPPAEKPVTQEPRKGALWVIPLVLAIFALSILVIGEFTDWSWIWGMPTAAPTAVPVVAIVSTQVSPKDGMTMVYVPAGEFTMGSPDEVGSDNEHPQHKVTLDAFWIDQTEVTNAMYAQCVAAGNCSLPASSGSDTRDSYYGNPQYDDYPVFSVDWDQANAYCQWVDRQLPTEAQWEYAARGTDGRTYPWGNEPPAGNLVNFADRNTSFDWAEKTVDDGYEDTAPVGSYPDGESPHHVLDMAGNVWEWVADWYAAYPSGSVTNPQGPSTSQEYRVLRSGGWGDDENIIRSAYRLRNDPSNADYGSGFRCSLSLD